MTADSSSLLSTRVSLPDQTLWFGRAELHDDYIHVSGWHWTGRHERYIDLDDLERVDTWSRTDGPNMILRTPDTVQHLQLRKGIMLWHWKLKELGVEVVGRG